MSAPFWLGYKAIASCSCCKYHVTLSPGFPLLGKKKAKKVPRRGKLGDEAKATLLKMGRNCSTSMCHYWDMSVK